MNTNARSLCPKINSFLDSFEEMNCNISIVTETWLTDGQSLDEDLADLEHGGGVKFLVKNRCPGSRGVSHGGVAIAFKKGSVELKNMDFDNRDDFEIVVGYGTMLGHSRKVVVIGAYLPPNYTIARGQAALDFISDLVLDIKRKFRDPFIIIGGDFNQWDASGALADFPDIDEIQYGPTREDRRIDRLFCTFRDRVEAFGTLEPLETDDGSRKSDHRIGYFEAELERAAAFEWITYTYRFYNEDGVKLFGDWICSQDWSRVASASSSDEKTDVYQSMITAAVDACFPLVTTRKKSTDLPWISWAIRKRIARRKRLFKLEGRSAAWKRLKKVTDEMIAKRKEKYRIVQINNLTHPRDSNRSFFKSIKAFGTSDKPKQFDVRSLCPGKDDQEVAEELADFFNRISAEFRGLDADDIPVTRSASLPKLDLHQVAGRIRRFRKPRSMVKGDVFPDLVTKYADFFAIPLCSIYNKITTSKKWPLAWKVEHVTVIPKTTCPAGFSDLRNISCTLLASKMYESFVLEWLSSQVHLKWNQYGGVKGCGTTHMLVQLYQNICEGLEDFRAGVLLTAIDYAKAFNRMSYQHCLSSLAKLGASSDILAIIATFLSDRVMTVKVGSSWSDVRPVTGGCPQGSILGVFLFNATINDLEDAVTEHPSSSDEPGPSSGPDESGPSSGPDETGPSSGGDRPGTSTPLHTGGRVSPVLSPVSTPVAAHPRFNFLPEVREVQRRLRYHSSDNESEPEETNTVNQAKWKRTPIDLLKYVDDNLSCDKINMDSADRTDIPDGPPHRDKHALQTQNLYRTVVRAAVNKGMAVNGSKTKILLVSDALSYVPRAHFYDSSGERLQNLASEDEMKCLGFHVSSRPSMKAHVAAMRKRFRQRYWVLRHLKSVGFSEEELVRVYTTVIRPIADYCSPVYHSQLTDEQDEEVERLQNMALKCIYGPRASARTMRSLAGISTLRARRIEQTDKFALKAAASDRFARWFPLRSARQTRGSGRTQYAETYARCDRLYNSPVFYMRRRLNGKTGKEYGLRYKEYRED